MASLTTVLAAAGRAALTALHPRENLSATGTLGAVNAEIIAFCDGCGTVTLDLRGTFSETVQLQGSVDGVNFTAVIPVRPVAGGVFVAAVAGAVAGIWQGSCSGFTKVKAIVTAYTSGAATATLAASNALFDDFAKNGSVTPLVVTATGAAAAAVTLTLPAPGAGLRQYLTYIKILRSASLVLTAGAAPTVITTTNLPGTLAFTMGADAAAIGVDKFIQEDFAYPLMSVAQNTATTIVCPATTGAIWRVTVGYYVAP